MHRLALLWCVLAGCGSAATAPPPVVAEPSAEAPSRRPTLLWRVTQDGRVSHLLGTCHVGLALDDALPEEHRGVLDDARVVVTEMDISSVDADVVMARGVLPEDESLHDALGSEAFIAFSRKLIGLPAAVLDRMRPWMAYSVALAADAGAVNATAGPMDGEVVERGRRTGAEAVYLETAEQQLALFESMPPEHFLSGLRDSATEQDSVEVTVETLILACAKGDVRRIESIVGDMSNEVDEALLTRRNRAWMPALRAELERGDAFVAVGAAHMLGPDGLLSMLEHDGYAIEQLRTSAPPARLDEPAPMQTPEAPSPEPPWPTALDAEQLAAIHRFVDSARSYFDDTFCAPSSRLRRCFALDAPTCESLVHRAALRCGEQTVYPPVDPADPEPLRDIVGCVAGGLEAYLRARGRYIVGPYCPADG